MKKTITIDLDELKLIKDAKKVILDPEQANSIVELLKTQNELANLVEQVKIALGEAGEKLDPSFKGLKSDDFNFSYRVYGSRYAIDPAFEDQIPEQMVKKTVKYSLVPKMVEDYFEAIGELPLGIVERERSKTPSLKLKDQDEK